MRPVGSHCKDTKRQLFFCISTSIANNRTSEWRKPLLMSSVTYCVCRGLHVCVITDGKTAENLEKRTEKNLLWRYNVQYEFQKRVYQIQNKNTIKYYRYMRKRKMAVKRKTKDKNRTQQYPEKKDVGRKMKVTGQSTAKWFKNNNIQLYSTLLRNFLWFVSRWCQ